MARNSCERSIAEPQRKSTGRCRSECFAAETTDHGTASGRTSWLSFTPVAQSQRQSFDYQHWSIVWFSKLSTLGLEGTSVDLSSASTSRTLSSLTNLTNVTVPTQILGPGQNVVTLEGQPTTIPFQVGVLNFDGVDDFVTTSPAPALGLNGSFTASAWVFPTQPIRRRTCFWNATNRRQPRASSGSSKRTDPSWFLWKRFARKRHLALNQWHQITWVYDQTAQLKPSSLMVRIRREEEPQVLPAPTLYSSDEHFPELA